MPNTQKSMNNIPHASEAASPKKVTKDLHLMCQDAEDEWGRVARSAFCWVELNSCIINAPLGRRFGQARPETINAC